MAGRVGMTLATAWDPSHFRRHFWRDSPTREVSASGQNYCGQGRLLPELYVLGAEHAATTSLDLDLHARGIKAAPKDIVKEWHFFAVSAGLPIELQLMLWLDNLPVCPKERKVMADFSNTNLFAIPFPVDLRWSPYGFQEKEWTNASGWSTPRLIRTFHLGLTGRMPLFLVMLRDPLARIHSGYYHWRDWDNGCSGCAVNETFADSFATNTRLLQRQPPQISDWFWSSFYARQVEAYLDDIDAKHFILVPIQMYSSVKPRDFSAYLLDRLGMHAEPWAEPTHGNIHDSMAPLDKELPRGSPVRADFEAAMAPETERLARVLASAHLRGAWLPGYQGEAGDRAQVKHWLVEHW